MRTLLPLAILVCSVLSATAPVGALAAGSIPLSVGIGAFLPTSTGSSLESVPTPGSVSVTQHGDIALELAIEPNLLSGGYRIAASVLSSPETIFR